MPDIGDVNRHIESAKINLKDGVQGAGFAEIHRQNVSRLLGAIVNALEELTTEPLVYELQALISHVGASATFFADSEQTLQAAAEGSDNLLLARAARETLRSSTALQGQDGVHDTLVLLSQDITDVQTRILDLTNKLGIVQTWLTDAQQGIAVAASGGVNAMNHLAAYQKQTGL